MSWTLSASAFSAELITSRGVLEDRSGTMSIEEVVGADFDSMGRYLTKGYTDSVHWLRISIKRPTNGEDVVIRIHPTILDEVTLFEPDPLTAHGWNSRVLGDRSNSAILGFANVALDFVVRPAAQETIYFIRLQTTSSSFMILEALEESAARILDYRFVMIQAIYTAFLLWLLLWAVSDYLSGRQKVVAWFILYQSVYIVFHLAITGRLPQFLPFDSSDASDKITSFLICVVPLFSLMFHRSVFAHYSPSRLAMRALDAFIVLILLQLLILAYGYTSYVLHANALLNVLMVPLFLLLAFTAHSESVPKLNVMRIFYILISLSQLISQLPLLGWLEPEKGLIVIYLFQGIITSSLMFILLHTRSRHVLRKGKQALLNLELSRQQLELEKKRREEQSRFMDMLNHELKTPLSVIRMAMGPENGADPTTKHVIQAARDIDAVVERCLQADQMEQQKMVPRNQRCDVKSILHEFQSNDTQEIKIKIDKLPEIYSDPQLLHIIFSNLIGNALKYRKSHTPVQIVATPSAEKGRDGILLAVVNIPGDAGMPDPQRVFEKYYRSPGAHGNTGSGIGLYLVHNMMALLNGRVGYCPAENKVRFELWLPS